MHPGEKDKYTEHEPKLLSFIEVNKKFTNPIISIALIVEFMRICKDTKKLSYEGIYSWFTRFMNKYYLSFRSGTYVRK